MKLCRVIASLEACLYTQVVSATPSGNVAPVPRHYGQLPLPAPRIFLLSFYADEENIWATSPDFPYNIYAQNITLPLNSMLYPHVHCVDNYEICQITTGEGEINAAVSIAGLISSGFFDLRHTYFIIAGVAGIHPGHGSFGSVTFAEFSVQVALQYEIDIRELPTSHQNSSYFPQGISDLGETYPNFVYGTEVLQLNTALRDAAMKLAGTVNLTSPDQDATKFSQQYASAYSAAQRPPAVVACDVATSDVWWSGNILAQGFEKTFNALTNNTGLYCTTAQEDSAILEAILRGHYSGRTDFTRILLIRGASDYDRPPPNGSALENLFFEGLGYNAALTNLGTAGAAIVKGILADWNSIYAAGLEPPNYYGDAFNTLNAKYPAKWGLGVKTSLADAGTPVTSIVEPMLKRGNRHRKRRLSRSGAFSP